MRGTTSRVPRNCSLLDWPLLPHYKLCPSDCFYERITEYMQRTLTCNGSRSTQAPHSYRGRSRAGCQLTKHWPSPSWGCIHGEAHQEYCTVELPNELWSEGHHMSKSRTSHHSRELSTLEDMSTLVTLLQTCDGQIKLMEGILYHALEVQLACMCQLRRSCGYGKILPTPTQKMGWGGIEVNPYGFSKKTWRNTTQKEVEKNSKEKSEDFFVLPLKSVTFNTGLLIDWAFQGLGLRELQE